MNWKLGRFAGIPINVHWSFWLLPLFLLLSGNIGGAQMGFQLAILFAIFGCVLLHELGHAMMARVFGVRTRDITLYPIGGVASLTSMPRSPFAEGAIALAGPAVNLLMIAVLAMVQFLLWTVSGTAGGAFIQSLMIANAALAIFNMLPVFPLDGGRVFRAALGAFTSHERATEIAASVGQVFAVALGIFGLFSGGTLVFIALFIFFAARAELMMVRAQNQATRFTDSATDPRGADRWTVDPRGFDPRNDDGQQSDPGSSRRSAMKSAFVLLDRNGRPVTSYGGR